MLSKLFFLSRTQLLFVLALFAFVSCKTDDEPKGAYEKGVFIVNEGNFGTPNGEISFFDRSSKIVINKLFTTVNSDRTALGDVVQSMFIHQDKAYIVANNSNTLEITDANTFKSIGVIKNWLCPDILLHLVRKAIFRNGLVFRETGGFR